MAEDDKPIEIDESGQPEELAENAGQAETTEAAGPVPAAPELTGTSKWRRFKNWYQTHKKISIPLTLALLVAALMAAPQTRYPLAGAVYKKDYKVSVIDSVTKAPVSGAKVSAGNISAETDGEGIAVLRLSVGQHQFQVSKTYYSDDAFKAVVPLLKQEIPTGILLQATGRQVKISVSNKISRQPLADVEVKLGETTAKTDSQGATIAVVSQQTKTEQAVLTLDGYNPKTVQVEASDTEIKDNHFALTPAGKVYFLSKLSGQLDVVKTNLDGSGRKTVIPATGHEKTSSTTLLPSDDQKYLVLLAKRAAGPAKPYLIDTVDDSIAAFDGGNASFTPVGWSGHRFIYLVDRTGIGEYGAGKYVLKSFNAPTRQITILDQNAAYKTNGYDYAERFDDYEIAAGKVLYTKTWISEDYIGTKANDPLKGKTAALFSVNNDGTGKQTIRTWNARATYYAYMDTFRPNIHYVYVHHDDGTNRYKFENGAATPVGEDDIPEDAYHTYLFSPSGRETFWDETRDGKQTLFIGDANAGDAKQVAKLSEYRAYGWFNNDYLLATKASELYVLPKSGIKKDKQAVKISDYHAGYYYEYY